MIIATKQKIKVITPKKDEVKKKSTEVPYTPEPCKSCGNKKN